jgi:signal transduction histidine kinase
MGGLITFQSRKQEGSTFSLMFPISGWQKSS